MNCEDLKVYYCHPDPIPSVTEGEWRDLYYVETNVNKTPRHMTKKYFLISAIIIFLIAGFFSSLKFYSAKQKADLTTPSSIQPTTYNLQLTTGTVQPTTSIQTTGSIKKPTLIPTPTIKPATVEVEDIEEIDSSLADSIDLEEPLDFDFSFDF